MTYRNSFQYSMKPKTLYIKVVSFPESQKAETKQGPYILLHGYHRLGKDDNFSTRLVVQAKYVTTGFPHTGKIGIKVILCKHIIDY